MFSIYTNRNQKLSVLHLFNIYILLSMFTVYGLTETSGLAVCTPQKDSPEGGGNVPPGSVGLPVPGCELKVVVQTVWAQRKILYK